jgi:hypothetical protein
VIFSNALSFLTASHIPNVSAENPKRFLITRS